MLSLSASNAFLHTWTVLPLQLDVPAQNRVKPSCPQPLPVLSGYPQLQHPSLLPCAVAAGQADPPDSLQAALGSNGSTP